MPINVKQFMGGQHLSLAELSDRVVIGMITEVGSKQLGSGRDGKRDKIIIRVEGIDKPIALNATSLKLLASAYGDDAEKWAGKQVRVARGETKFGEGLMLVIIVSPVGVPQK